MISPMTVNPIAIAGREKGRAVDFNGPARDFGDENGLSVIQVSQVILLESGFQVCATEQRRRRKTTFQVQVYIVGSVQRIVILRIDGNSGFTFV